MEAKTRFILSEIPPRGALCPGSWKEIIVFLLCLATSVHIPKAAWVSESQSLAGLVQVPGTRSSVVSKGKPLAGAGPPSPVSPASVPGPIPKSQSPWPPPFCTHPPPVTHISSSSSTPCRPPGTTPPFLPLMTINYRKDLLTGPPASLP